MTDEQAKEINSRLKACPHCGSLASIEYDDKIFFGQHYEKYPGQSDGYLIECAGQCHSMTCWWHTVEEAISAWNMRNTEQEKEKEIIRRIQERLDHENRRYNKDGDCDMSYQAFHEAIEIIKEVISHE